MQSRLKRFPLGSERLVSLTDLIFDIKSVNDVVLFSYSKI